MSSFEMIRSSSPEKKGKIIPNPASINEDFPLLVSKKSRKGSSDNKGVKLSGSYTPPPKIQNRNEPIDLRGNTLVSLPDRTSHNLRNSSTFVLHRRRRSRSLTDSPKDISNFFANMISKERKISSLAYSCPESLMDSLLGEFAPAPSGDGTTPSLHLGISGTSPILSKDQVSIFCIKDLPKEIMVHIFSFFSVNYILCTLSLCCKGWRRISNDTFLWQTICQKNWVVKERGAVSWMEEFKTRKKWEKDSYSASPTSRFLRQSTTFKSNLSGSLGLVRAYLAIDRDEGLEVCWEEIPYSSLHRLYIPIKKNVVEKLYKLQHPNIVPVLTSWLDPNKEVLVIISPRQTGKSLHTFISRSGGRLKIHVIVQWITQLISAMEYLEESNTSYGHCKTNNIFVDPSTGTLLLNRMDLISTSYLPPGESSSGDHMENIWNLGLCALEIITSDVPYPDYTYHEAIARAKEGFLPSSLFKLKEPAKSFFIRCLSIFCVGSPPPTFSELRNHPLLTKVNDDLRASNFLSDTPWTSSGLPVIRPVTPKEETTGELYPQTLHCTVDAGSKSISFDFSTGTDDIDSIVDEMALALSLDPIVKEDVRNQVIQQLRKQMRGVIRL